MPHPALGFPTTLSLNYRQYSGWLSKGLPHWDIDKVVLTDSFGRSHSICSPSTKLISGTPVRLKLSVGSCELNNQKDYGNLVIAVTPLGESSLQNTEQATYVDDAVDTAKTRKNILNLGTSFQLDKNQSFAFNGRSEVPWQPIYAGNSLDKEQDKETSRSFGAPDREEIFEPVLNDKRFAVGKERHFGDYNGPMSEEIMEPILRATVPGTKRGTIMSVTKASISSTTEFSTKVTPKILKISEHQRDSNYNPATSDSEEITVQLFPLRLGEILQKAERYARETLFTFISVQAPRFFGLNFGNNNAERAEEWKSSDMRVPRYIPKKFEMSTKNSNPPRMAAKRADFVSGERSRSDIFNLIRFRKISFSTFSNGQKPKIGSRNSGENLPSYYTNPIAPFTKQIQSVEPEMGAFYIDLPTYRPSGSRFMPTQALSSQLQSTSPTVKAAIVPNSRIRLRSSPSRSVY